MADVDYTPRPDPGLDRAVAGLAEAREEWARTSIGERVRLLEGIRRRTDFSAGRWVAAASAAKGFDPESQFGMEEWLSGPYGVLAAVNALQESLQRLDRGLTTYKPSWVKTGDNGAAVVQVLPVEWWEPLLLSGYRLEVRMQPRITPANLAQHTATAYRFPSLPARVCAVLGAGNINSIPPLDTLHKLYAENQVVALKLNPINDYLEPIFSEIFAELMERGFVRILKGGAEVGAQLINHPLVETVHITGSDQTHDLIVFGAGAEGEERRRRRQPLLQKPISSELGGVSPFIVVPGPWTEADLRYQAENFATQKLLNGGFNCIAAQVLVQAEGWGLADRFVEHIHDVMDAQPYRVPYYPGAEDRSQRAGRMPGSVLLGELSCAHVMDVDPDSPHPAFEEEFFSAAFASTRLPYADPAVFLDAAVDFANERLAGTLGAGIVIHPSTMADLGARFGEAINRLRYGSVAINVWTAFNYLQPLGSWGAYPGHTLDDIGSGIGVVHNALLFERPEKSVARGPFRPLGRSLLAGEAHLAPKPPWFITARTGTRTAELFTRFLVDRSPRHLPALLASALRA